MLTPNTLAMFLTQHFGGLLVRDTDTAIGIVGR